MIKAEGSANDLKECATSPRHITGLQTDLHSRGQEKCGLGDSPAPLLEFRVASPAGQQQAGSKGGEGRNLWEGHCLAHPGAPGQYPAAHRTPECSCRTAAWTWSGWTLRSRSKTCSDNDKSGQRGTAQDRSARQCLPTVPPAPAHSLPGHATRGSVHSSP